jgi:2-polyprenyl-3-methyl-5-hydroxy-6-metoxy-1,4-benzoquinol methylase
MNQPETLIATLQQHRQRAAELSAGISNEIIYTCFESILIEKPISGTVLDWGAGQGLLTNRLFSLNHFSSITAVDIQSRPQFLDSSIHWIEADLNDHLDLEKNSFDVIVSAEVIEHLENPRAVAREWFRLLKPGGLLIFSTPNNESLRALMALVIRGHFVDFGDSCYPAHITALVRKDISRILCETGFSPPQFVFTNIEKIPKFPHHYWQNLPFFFFGGLRFSDNLLAVPYKSIS